MGLLTQKNDDLGTISVTEQGCAIQISKVESHLSDRFSYGVLTRILSFVTKWPQALKFLDYLNQRKVNWIIYCSMYCSRTLDDNNCQYFKQTHSPAQSRKKFDCLFTTDVSLFTTLLRPEGPRTFWVRHFAKKSVNPTMALSGEDSVYTIPDSFPCQHKKLWCEHSLRETQW